MTAIRTGAALVCAAVCLLVGASAATAALPVVYNLPAAFAASALNPGGSPPGANDWSCRPSAAHPRPVVLVHGTVENRLDNWNALSPLLKNAGYCVYALNYGDGGGGVVGVFGTARVASSAAELAAFVDRVLAATSAPQVDLVGHSQGGMMPRVYLRDLGGAPKVHALVALSPSNHGTTASGLLTLAAHVPAAPAVVAAACPACDDQTVGSPFITSLNATGDTVAGVAYTVIQTRYDEVVTPYTSAFLSGPNVTNVLLQDQCPADGAEHLAISYDHIALREVLNALDPSTARRAICTPVAPFVGG
jgi:triacylglycerol esterase/lipase EstA (alpha/beta hydrolase family)